LNRLEEMNREELLEVVRIKDDVINELRNEIELYKELTLELQKKLVEKG